MNEPLSHNFLPDTPLAKTHGLAARIVAGEAVIVQPNKGLVTVLNQVGSRIWELLDTAQTPDDLASAIAEDFEVTHDQALNDTLEFLKDMFSKGLIRLENQRDNKNL